MPVGLLFSGQGAQAVGMGKTLAEAHPHAASRYAEADAILGWKLSEISFQGPQETLTETRVCQPALFVHGVIAAELWQTANPDTDVAAALGLSLGELTALTLAGAFDFETGLKVVAERGRLMQEACEATDGTMASVIGGSLEDVQALADEHDIDVANLNCPGQIVLSGETSKVMAAVEAAGDSGKFKRVIPLTVAGAYHSRLMAPARDAFGSYLDEVTIAAPKVPVYSNVTAAVESTPDEIRSNLTAQVVSSVRWEESMKAVAATGLSSYVECGVGGVLAGLARRIDRSLSVKKVAEAADLED